MRAVQTELAAFQAPAAAPTAIVPALPIDDVGSLGAAYVQAIRAGHANAVQNSVLGLFFGPNAPNRAPPQIVTATQDGLYKAHGGWTGGLAIEEQDKLFNWALGLMIAVQTLHCTLFVYADVVRAVG
jgi:hypothetical protein